MTDIPTIQLECKKDGLQQLQNGTWKLSLTVNGEDMEKAIGTLGKAPMGTIYMVVLAEVGDDGKAVDRSGGEEKERKHDTESQRCAMLCQRGDFQDWLSKNYRPQWAGGYRAAHNGLSVARMLEERTELTVKAVIGSNTRKVLDSDPEGEPSQRWQRLKAKYYSDTGKVAERTR